MPKNAHLHIVVETDFLNYLKVEAKKKMLTVSEFCRLKLQTNLQLDRIEYKIEKLMKNGNK
jgi:hypothetical protein